MMDTDIHIHRDDGTGCRLLLLAVIRPFQRGLGVTAIPKGQRTMKAKKGQIIDVCYELEKTNQSSCIQSQLCMYLHDISYVNGTKERYEPEESVPEELNVNL